MLFSIIGVTVTVASDSERTYHVAVSSRLYTDAQNYAYSSVRLSVSLRLAWSSLRLP